MPYFRKFIRKPHLPLQQFVNRMGELFFEEGNSVPNQNIRIRATERHDTGPIPQNLLNGGQQFRKLKNSKFCIGLSLRDNCCILRDSSICIVSNIILFGGTYYLVVRRFRNVTSLYDVGIPSATVGVFKCFDLSPNDDIVNYLDVEGKCYRMPYSRNVNDIRADSSSDEADEPCVEQYVVIAMNSSTRIVEN